MRIKITLVVTILAATLLSAPATNGGEGKTEAQEKQDSIHWIFNLDEGLVKAKKERKPVMIDFTAVWCPPCKEMEKTTFSNPAVIRISSSFIPVRIDTDNQREVAAKYNALARLDGGIGIPNILFLAPDGAKLKHIVGYKTASQLASAMNSALALFRKSQMPGILGIELGE